VHTYGVIKVMEAIVVTHTSDHEIQSLTSQPMYS